MKAMFCTKCGSNLPEHAKFCSACGAPAQSVVQSNAAPMSGAAVQNNDVDTGMSQKVQPNYSQPFLAIPVYIKTGLVKREAAAVLINQNVTVYILIGNDSYRQIQKDKGANIDGGYFKKTAGMMSAFRDYVYGMSHLSAEQIRQMYPNAMIWNTDDIRSLRIHLDYDAANEQYRNEYLFDLHIGRDHLKGALDPNVSFKDIKKPLKELLGRKFHQ